MPIPTPKSDEDQSQYIRRCYINIKDEYPTAQSLSICYNEWKKKRFKKV